MENSSPEQLVCQALQYACSQDAAILKQAEQKLSEWEIEPGFYLTLINIFQNYQIDNNIRLMAALYFKNGILKYWRKSAKNEILQSEKDQIRIQLISNFNEPYPQLAVQIASLIAKIARIDCPREWPDLIPILLEIINNTNSLQQQRALLVLHHVVKALSSKRMYHDKKEFMKLTSQIYSFILNLWDGFTTQFFQSVQENNTQDIVINYLEKALLALRILRKLTIYGIYKPHSSENCMMFLDAIFRRTKESLECRYELKRRQSPEILIDLIEKFILKQMKILNEFLEKHPISFINYVPTALEFSFNYVFHTGTNFIFENNVISFTNFAIHCINLMKGILSSIAFKNLNQEYDQNNATVTSSAITTTTSSSAAATTNELTITEAMSNITINNVDNIKLGLLAKKQFFTNERLTYICEKLITHYFILTQQDLELWIDDPETFALDEGGESWKYALRPCTEAFFSTLFCGFQKEMSAEILKYIRKAEEINLTPNSDLKTILLKDAIYTAVGLFSFNFYHEIDFDAWLTGQLLNELKIKTDNFRIIRRKVIWLIGKWLRITPERGSRSKVYEICIELLGSDEDMCVRLAASKTLMSAVDDFDFQSEVFLNYLEPSFTALFILLKEAKECETKMNVLCIMSFIVNKMSDYIQPHTNNLITYLPRLWETSEDHNMLRCAIISTLIEIVKSIADVPSTLLQFIYPVIEISTNIKNSCSVYLMEEGLELWLVVTQNSSNLTSELLNLCENIIPIIQNSSENLRSVLYIIEAYVLINPIIYLQRYGKDVVSTCAYLMNDMRSEGIITVLKLFETCLKIEPNITVELLKPVIPFVFEQIHLQKDNSKVMTRYLTLISHVLIKNQQIFIEALQSLNIQNPFETILDIWISKIPSTEIHERKLMAIALGSILTVDNEILHKKIPGILQNICEVLNDIMKDDGNGSLEDILILIEGVHIGFSDFFYDSNSYHHERFRQLSYKDPVHRVVLSDYIQSQLKTLKQNIGEQRYQSLMSLVDPGVLSNLSEYMDILIQIQNNSLEYNKIV